jgi:hypothetical protein
MMLHKLRIVLAAILVAAAAVSVADSASASLRYQDHSLFFWDFGP